MRNQFLFITVFHFKCFILFSHKTLPFQKVMVSLESVLSFGLIGTIFLLISLFENI